MIDKTLTEEAINIVTGARNQAYDAPERNFHRIALAWESITDRAYSAAEVSLMMVALKVVRESHMHQRDNIVDGIGYLLTADEVTPKEVAPKKELAEHPAATSFKEQWQWVPERSCACGGSKSYTYHARDYCDNSV